MKCFSNYEENLLVFIILLCVIVQRKKSRFYLTTQTFQKSYQQKDKQPRGVEIGTWISFDKGVNFLGVVRAFSFQKYFK